MHELPPCPPGARPRDDPAWRASAVGPLLAQRYAFLQTVRDLGESNATVIPSWPGATTQDALDLSIGVPGCIVVVSLSSRDPSVGCSFYIRDDKSLFARLHAQREQIERAVGARLEWRENPEYKASRIDLRRAGDWRDPPEAPELARWHVETAETFAPVFPPHIA